MLSFMRSEILMGSKHGLHLCTRSLITTCRWPLRCNWGDHSLVKLNSLLTVQRTMCMSCFQDSQLFAVASHHKNTYDGVIFTPFRSNDHSDTCVQLSFKICGGSLVRVWLPFLAKCSFICLIQLYWASWVCVYVCLDVLLRWASIYSSLLTYYFSLGIHSCMVYILLLADSLYPFPHSAPSIYCVPRHSWTKAIYQNMNHMCW